MEEIEDALQKLGARFEAAAKLKEENLQHRRQSSKLQQRVDKLNAEIADLESELKRTQAEKESFQKINEDLSAKLAEQEKSCEALEQNLKITPSVHSKLSKAQELLQFDIDITSIRWDYSAPDDVAKGYIANKANGTLIPFEIKAKRQEVMEEKLWDFIELHNDWSDIVEKYKTYLADKENINTN